MSMLEKTLVLSICEFRLLIRNGRRLVAALGLPIIGGLFFGLAGKMTTNSLTPYGLLLILPMSSLSLMDTSGRADSRRHAGLVKPALDCALWAIVAVLTLAAQAGLYIGVTALLEPQSAPAVNLAALALALSLAIGFTSYRLHSSR